MARQVNMLAAKLDDLSSNPWILLLGGENQLLGVGLLSPHTHSARSSSYRETAKCHQKKKKKKNPS